MHRRADDNRRSYRDLWLVIITGLVALALSHSDDALNRVQQGRRVALTVSCAVLSSVSESGREVIADASRQPESPFFRFLERHGYPPAAAREAAARAAADTYVASISNHIEQAIGHRSDGLVNPDGTVNCAQLARISQIRH